MQPLETSYNGYRFRSRLEARWAVFFDACGMQYRYEPEGYDLAHAVCPLPAGHYRGEEAGCVCRELERVSGKALWYLPDFFLPGVGLRSHPPGLFFEVKGIADRAARDRCALLGALTGSPVVLVTIPPLYPSHDVQEGFEQMAPWWDDYMCFMRCHQCGYIKIEFAESNYEVCPRCGGSAPCKDALLDHAGWRARQERFA